MKQLNEEKEKKGGFLSMLLGTLVVSLLRRLTGKGTISTSKGTIIADENVLCHPIF